MKHNRRFVYTVHIQLSVFDFNVVFPENAFIVLQGELPACDDIVVKLIGYDGNITEKKLGQSTVHLPWVRQTIIIYI